MPDSPLAAARSLLFVPALRPERFAKALASGADAVIIDLEDAVAPGDKAAARGLLERGFAQFSAQERTRVLVRINAAGTPWHMDDLQLLARLTPQGLAGVMCPKAESTVQLHGVAQAVGARCVLLPLVESVAGLDAVDALAQAPQVQRLVFGNLDFQADAGLACGPGEEELVPVRLAMVLASRRAGLAPPLDGVTASTQDTALVQAHAERAKRGGFGGKLCIHPAQVAAVNAAFTPGADEVAWERRVLAGFAAANGGVVDLDGRMVDAPVVRLAQRTLAQVDGGAGAADAPVPAPPSPAQQLREFWDKRYARPEYVYGTEPNEFLAAQAPAVFPAGGRVLCLADGEGRNSVWLAGQGFDVTAVDISPEGVAKARRLAEHSGVAARLTSVEADVTGYPLGDAQWAAIVSIFLHLPAKARRELHRAAFAALRPGGVLLWEAYGPEQLGRGTGGPPDPALLPPLADVLADFDGLAGCVVLHQWTGVRLVVEGPLHTGEGFVTQLLVRRRD